MDKGLKIGINPVFTSGPLVSSLYDPGSVNDPGSLPHLYSCLPIICTANYCRKYMKAGGVVVKND